MKRKLKLHSWEYFKKNHYIEAGGYVKKYKNSRSRTFINKSVVEKRIYDATYSFPGPYTIDTTALESTYSFGDRRVISWMIEEIYTEESHPEYFI